MLVSQVIKVGHLCPGTNKSWDIYVLGQIRPGLLGQGLLGPRTFLSWAIFGPVGPDWF